MRKPDQNRARRFRPVAWLALAAVLSAVPQARTAEPSWPAGTYNYLVVDQSVREALTELGRNMGVPVQMGDDIKGRMTAGVPQGDARAFLEWVCSRYGLVWYFDGSKLHISNETDNQTEVVKLEPAALSGLSKRLDSLKIVDARFPVRIDRNEKIASISGPPAYIDLVKQTIDTFAEPPAQPVANAPVAVRVFRGRQVETQSVVMETPAAKTLQQK